MASRKDAAGFLVVHRLTFSVFTILVAALSACAPANAQEGPPLPPILTALEFFQPTPKTYSLESYCAGRMLNMQWVFDGEVSRMVSIDFGESRREQFLEPINAALSDIGGDVFARVSCSHDGIGMRFIQADFAGSSGARQVLFNIQGDEIREIHRYNFE